MTLDWRSKEVKKLIDTLTQIQDSDLMTAFLRDVATIKEIEDMAARWQAAKMIDQGVSYRDIANQSGLSTTTVARVAYWLNYGQGGYRQCLDRFHASAQ